MFKYFKEMRELKKDKLQYEVFLLGEVCKLVMELKKFNENKVDILNVVEKLKDVEPKDIAGKLAEVIHSMNQTEAE